MAKFRPRVPKALPITAIILLIIGLVAGPLINSFATEEQLKSNVLLNAIPFILIFVAIILGYITVIWAVVTALNNNISQKAYRIVESILIAGIIMGVIGMFQPWVHFGFKYGFIVLLFSTLGYILWSHVTPKSVQRQEELDLVFTGELEDNKR